MAYRYQTEVSHEGLHKYRVIKAATKYELEQKRQAITKEWDEQWSKKCERESRIKDEADSLEYAKEMTQQAEEIQEAMDRIILDDIEVSGFNPNDFKDFTDYPKPYPADPDLSKEPSPPNRSDAKYKSRLTGFAKLSKKKTVEQDASNQEQYEADVRQWEERSALVKNKNKEILEQYNDSLEQWKEEEKTFKDVQALENSKIDRFCENFAKGDVESVEWLITSALEKIKLPFNYSRSVEAEYDDLNKSIIIEYTLPVMDDIPSLKNISYIKSKKEFKESYHPETYLKKKYENVVYQIVLQILNYVFTLSLKHGIIDSVSINGKVHTIDKASGNEIEPYVLSLNVSRDKFDEVNLNAVDPKAWFKGSKGVSATSLANVTPIAPIVMMSREDKRFIEGYNVVDQIDDSINLAAIDWQDFENLIREIFEKEFSFNGGEVRITQASRDGGVDAVAFDPDPIRGGKIVIQAKRYTNIVGVSAVRDLYGTVLNEGATKGILVTTSNYGSGAYDFAQGKPITLMNGANLLYLLEKHHYKAKIDIGEAKTMLKV